MARAYGSWVLTLGFTLAACNGKGEGDPRVDDSDGPVDDSGTDDSGADDSGTDDTGSSVPDGARYELTLDPSFARSMTLADALPVLFGSVLDPSGVGLPSEVDWVTVHEDGSTSSGKGAIDSLGLWSADAMLADGDNAVTVSIAGTPTSLELEITHNAGYAFGGPLELDETVAYLGEPRDIEASITLTDADTDPTAVTIVRVDEDGNETAVGVLVDDGDVTQGDDIGSDAIYHGRFSLDGSETGFARFRVVLTRTSGDVARSEYRTVLVSEHIDPAVFDAQVAAGASYRERIEAAPTEGEKLDVLAEIYAELSKDPGVSQVAYNDSGRGLWFVYTNGVAAVVGTSVEGERSSAGSREVPVAPPPSRGRSTRCARASAAAPPSAVIGSGRILALSPYFWYFGSWDGGDVIEDLFLEDGCASVDAFLEKKKGFGSVEDFKRLSEYGAVFISSHGDSYFAGLDPVWTEQFGWNGPFGQVIMYADHPATKGDLAYYEDDLVAGRLVLCDNEFCVAPTFIRHYAGGRMPNSLVFAATCRSSFNGTLASAFLESGAGAFLGFSDYVDSDFTYETSVALVTDMLAADARLGDSWVAGQKETDKDPAEFQLFGSSEVEFDFEGIQDAGFESGDPFTAWNGGSSQASAIPTFYGSTPTEGRYMMLLTSGIGDMIPSIVSQTFCIDEGAHTLSFDWNFFTEDQYEGGDGDIFYVTIQAETTVKPYYYFETLLFVSYSTLYNDLVELKGVTFSDECPPEDCVESTGWRSFSYTLAPEFAFATGPAKVTMGVTQEGGPETAVLVDDVRLTP